MDINGAMVINGDMNVAMAIDAAMGEAAAIDAAIVAVAIDRGVAFDGYQWSHGYR